MRVSTHSIESSLAPGSPVGQTDLMRARIAEGQGSPWRGEIIVTPFLIVIEGREYTPLDDLRGIVVETLDDTEERLLGEAGFVLSLLQ